MMVNGRYKNCIASLETFDNLSDCEDGETVCSKEGKGKRLWRKIKYQLVEYHSLPAYLRDNEFILGYYRAEWPLKQVLLSIFSIHNETLNVWTHLIGFFLFLFLTMYTVMRVPEVVDLNSLRNLPDLLRRADLHKIQTEFLNCLPSLPNVPDLLKFRDDLKTSLPSLEFLKSLSSWNIFEAFANCLPERFSRIYQTDDSMLHGVTDDLVNMIAPLMLQRITRWPFFTFLGGAMFCLLASSTCHLLACHSESLSYVMLRMDYAGIAALITTSFYPPVYYSVHVQPLLLQPLLGLHYNIRNHHNYVLAPPCLPKARVPKIPCLSFLRNGHVGRRTYNPQACIVQGSARGPPNYRIRGVDGHILWARSVDLRYEDPREVEAWQV